MDAQFTALEKTALTQAVIDDWQCRDRPETADLWRTNATKTAAWAQFAFALGDWALWNEFYFLNDIAWERMSMIRRRDATPC